MRVDIQGMTIGLTGVSGFIGRHLANRLLDLGAHVRGLDLRPSDASEVEFIEGDVLSPDDVEELVDGCDLVIHAAAIVKEGGDRRLFDDVNVGGTEIVVQAARAARVKHFLQISSVTVYGFRQEGEIGEESPLSGEGNPYSQSKIDSERVALAEHRAGEFDVSVIRPGDVYGPGSLPWTIRPVRMMKAGVFTLASGGRGLLSHVYIDNLIDGILLTIQSGAGGEVFNLTDGRTTTCREFFEYYARMLGKNRLRSAPAFLLQGSLQISHGFLSVFGLEPRIHPDAIPFMTRRGTHSIAKARRLLGYEPRIPLGEGMSRTAEWLRAEGLIPLHLDRVS